MAKPGDGAYGALSVIAAAYAEARILDRLRPGSFRPPPKVEGAYVGLVLHPPPLPEDRMPAFVNLVHLAFNQRRKTCGTRSRRAGGGRRRRSCSGGRGWTEELGLGEWVDLASASFGPGNSPGCQ